MQALTWAHLAAIFAAGCLFILCWTVPQVLRETRRLADEAVKIRLILIYLAGETGKEVPPYILEEETKEPPVVLAGKRREKPLDLTDEHEWRLQEEGKIMEDR